MTLDDTSKMAQEDAVQDTNKKEKVNDERED